jgi:radical SAM protein with 4Fe4S-binding SPASM domain
VSKSDNSYSAPTCINLEITEVCNFKCKHCYNPWREESLGVNSLTEERADLLIDEFVKCGVFHLILSGGEPFSRFNLLEYIITIAVKKGLSVSVNSTLSLATPEKIIRLRKAGLDHILASWYDIDEEKTNNTTGTKNSYNQVIRGIKCAVENGIRVSVNTICTNNNKDNLYESGKLVHSLGVTQFIAHRVVPPAYDRTDQLQHRINQQISMQGLDELLRLKKDTGIKVGTLISYPLCLLGDLEKYADFVGRGCPTQSGHRFNVNSTGTTHACVMEDKEYGNVFDIGLKKVFENAKKWRDKSYYFEGCTGCDYIDVCQTGCRMDAFASDRKMNGKDPLWKGKEFIVKPYKIIKDKSVVNKVKKNAELIVPSRIRWRNEKEFYLLNIRWANTIEVPYELAIKLINFQKNNVSFTLKDVGDNYAEFLAMLLYKDAISSPDISIDVKKTGVSIDPSKIKF